MLNLRAATAAHRKALWQSTRWIASPRRRGLLTLAIETSCDDTSVAIVEKNNRTGTAKIHFLWNTTADLTKFRGIHPLKALESHQENLAKLVDESLKFLPPPPESPSDDPDTENPAKWIYLDSGRRQKPDFISVTRGPGMRSNLFTGMDTAKGLAVAWQIPFMAVHHMQAHLLTPRLVTAVAAHSNTDSGAITKPLKSRKGQPITRKTKSDPESDPTPQPIKKLDPTPKFPFLSLLASGGHTMLVSSKGLTEHKILATKTDIAIGEALDKVARMVLPEEIISTSRNTMYGKLLEQYAFPNGPQDYADYVAPRTRGEEIASAKKETEYGWNLTVPYAQSRTLAYSFASLETAVTNIMAKREIEIGEISEEERVLLARETMRVCFEHLASRIVIALEAISALDSDTTSSDTTSTETTKQKDTGDIKTLVVSGGVAANKYLMTVLQSFLDVRGFGHLNVIAPPVWLCTDNAAMIGWAGIEMYERGWRGEMDAKALKTWPLESPWTVDMSWGVNEQPYPPPKPGFRH
ncbi:hypothetical protein BDV12DRAFT_46193 [Aspergillus spectabilis]